MTKIQWMRIIALTFVSIGGVRSGLGVAMSRNRDETQRAAPNKNQRSVVFVVTLPPIPPEMALLKLAPQAPPSDLVNRLLSTPEHNIKLTPLKDTKLFQTNNIEASEQLIGVVTKQHVWAWVDCQTGDAAIYPQLDRPRPIRPEQLAELSERARRFLQSEDFIPHDTTRLRVDEALLLKGAMLSRRGNGDTRLRRAPAPYFAYFRARRYVDAFPVYGPGSRAFVALGESAAVNGLLRIWKKATVSSDRLQPSDSADEVIQKISRQLSSFAKSAEVFVDRIEIVYYDANRQFLQPVYRYTARIHRYRAETGLLENDNFVVGYVPYSAGIEPVPALGEEDGDLPSEKQCEENDSRPETGAAIHSVSVGRYVTRNEAGSIDCSSSWVANANDFMNSLYSSVAGKHFANAQYCWARSRLFLSTGTNRFINGVRIGLVEADGNWWYFQTQSGDTVNCCDPVHIAQIKSPGYGPSAGGKLSFWIIHSCEVIPSPDDSTNWAGGWWNVFGGVRSTVGYRTLIRISDGAEEALGSSIGKLAPVVSSWLSDVIMLGEYADHDVGPGHDGKSHPLGRPVSISNCGHDEDSVFSTSVVGPAECLSVWWFPD